MKEAVACSHMMSELGFGGAVRGVPLDIDNTSTLNVAGSSNSSGRTKLAELWFFFIRELVRKGKITLHHLLAEANIADLGTSFLPNQRHQHIINLVGNVGVQDEGTARGCR